MGSATTFAHRVGLAALIVVCVVAAAAPAASAEPVASDLACMFTGLTGQLSPGISAGVSGAEQDGMFSFTATQQPCAYVDLERLTILTPG